MFNRVYLVKKVGGDWQQAGQHPLVTTSGDTLITSGPLLNDLGSGEYGLSDSDSMREIDPILRYREIEFVCDGLPRISISPCAYRIELGAREIIS